jgi:hypothetical protein
VNSGWIPGQPNDNVLAAICDLAPVVSANFPTICAEFKSDKMAFISGLTAGALDVLDK